MKSYFVIGTDTDCGKTHVISALIRYLQREQHAVMALKPVASGLRDGNAWLPEHDAVRLSQELGVDPALICPWSMPLPVSPHLAAQAQGTHLHGQAIVHFCQQPQWQTYDFLLIEGAGGLMVPLNDHETWVDVIRAGQWEVIVVVGMRLGCINHALLTMRVLHHEGLKCTGWIANCIEPNLLFLEENIQTIQAMVSAPLLGRVQDGFVNLCFI